MNPAAPACDPFPPAFRPELYYPAADREQELTVLRHLLTYTHLLPLVQGPPGMGKSVFLRRLRETAPRHWRIATLQTPAQGLDENALLETLAAAFEARADDPGARLFALQERLDRLQEQGDLPVLLIDDAEGLSPDALRLVAALAVGDEHLPPRLHAVLAATALSPAQIEAVRSLTEGGEDAPDPIKPIPLPPLDEAQTWDYLLTRLRACGLDPAPLLTPERVTALWRESQGIPGRLDALARAWLAQEAPPSAPPSAPARRLPLWPLLLLPVLAILLWPTDRPAPPQSPPAAPASDTIARPLPLPAPEPEPPARESKASEPPPRPAAKPEPPAPEPSPARAAAPAPAPAAPPETPTAATETAPPAPARAAARPTPPSENPPAGPALHDAAWLLAQPPGHYTLQLASSPRREALLDYARRLPPEIAPRAWFRFRRDGRDWYALVAGLYPDRASARRALDRLPTPVRRNKPWIRRLGDIQRLIRQAR